MLYSLVYLVLQQWYKLDKINPDKVKINLIFLVGINDLFAHFTLPIIFVITLSNLYKL